MCCNVLRVNVRRVSLCQTETKVRALTFQTKVGIKLKLEASEIERVFPGYVTPFVTVRAHTIYYVTGDYKLNFYTLKDPKYPQIM